MGHTNMKKCEGLVQGVERVQLDGGVASSQHQRGARVCVLAVLNLVQDNTRGDGKAGGQQQQIRT